MKNTQNIETILIIVTIIMTVAMWMIPYPWFMLSGGAGFLAAISALILQRKRNRT